MLNEKGKLFMRPHFPSKQLIPFDPWNAEIIFADAKVEHYQNQTHLAMKSELTTPVALLIFNRPDTTARVFEAIRQAKPPKLLVVADGARVDKAGEAEQCAATRAIINQVDWECEVLTNYSDVNLGCRQRVSSGLDWVFEQVEEAIILEDDCLPHPTFFRYCQELLEKYRDDERIMMISGDNFQFGRTRTEYSYYFSRYGHIWGWASWRRAWTKYDNSMQLWPELRDNHWLDDILESPQAVAYWSRIFEGVYNGFNTWDYIWLFTLWANQGLTILPHVNLVSNIGFGSGTHTTNSNSPLANMSVEVMNFPLKHPAKIHRNIQADDFTDKYMFSTTQTKSIMIQNSYISTCKKIIEHINNNKNIESINIINSINDQVVNYLYVKALAEIRLGCIDEARNSLQAFLRKIPNHTKARHLLQELTQDSHKEVEAIIQQALESFNQGEKIKALRLGEKAASLGVFVPGLHYLRAIFNSAVARYEEALEAAQQELEHNPNHIEAQQQVASLTKALIKPKKDKIPNQQRTWNTSLPYDVLMSIQNRLHNYAYRGVPILKNPFDLAIYPVLIWNLKPRTIIEIGSKSGGSGLWFGDLQNNFGIDGHVYSVDIVKVTKYSHSRVTFLEGDGQNLQETFSPEFFRNLPRPLLVIEDADHSYQTSKAVLDFFHPYLEQEEYIVIEDGIISDIVQDNSYNSGPHQALKAFLSQHNHEYEIDGEYCDFFGYNLTWATNGYLKKLTPAKIKSFNLSHSKALVNNNDVIQKLNQALNNNQLQEALRIMIDAKSLKQPIMGLYYLRAKYFLQIRQPAASIQSLYEELRYFPENEQAQDFLNQLLNQYPQFGSPNIQDSEFQEIYSLIQPYTMLSEARLYSLFTLTKRICEENIPGNFVECGVAAGGSTALVAAVIKRHTKQPRWVYAFDSFDGMPAPTEKDKSNGIPAEVTGWGTGTCAAPEASVKEICNKLGVGNLVQLVKGYFQDTLPKMRDRVGMIALLHMDGDWYESTKTIINNFYDRISNHGFVQVDDYGFWEGCRQALHEFEAERQIKFDLHQIDSTGVWFNCTDKFAINPVFETSLIAEFAEDDPVKYSIQSQMSQNERFQLYYALRKLLPITSSPLRFVEIGSFAGSSLFLNYKALTREHNNLEGWAIDPGLHPQLKSVLDYLPSEITHLRMFSHDALAQLQQIFERDGNYPPYIFVDGDHSYEGVKKDIINYYPLLASGGLMIFHDYLPPLDEQNSSSILFHHGGNEPGIRQACQELMENTYNCEIIEVPLLYPDDPTQTQAYLPIIPGVFSSLKIYRKPTN
ncbi:class I SAM-dependent methyltransferase [Limnospira fusiformis]|uniref:class I SAM-dependent methyltransferase n=1 Tax=Limnospira fusiformis TaxID=54297 RepID=UPI0034E0A5DB